MKKIFFILAVMGLLSGFYAGEPQVQENNKKEMQSSKYRAEASGIFGDKIKERESLLPPDADLTEPGDSVTNGKGMLTLLAASPVYDSFQLGGLDYIVKDVKLLKFKPTHPKGGSMERDVDFIKLDVEIINQNPFSLNFNPVHSIQVNNHELPSNSEFLLEKMDGKIGGGETKIGSLGYILNDSGTDVFEIEIRSSNATKMNNEEISKAASFKVILKRQP